MIRNGSQIHKPSLGNNINKKIQQKTVLYTGAVKASKKKLKR